MANPARLLRPVSSQINEVPPSFPLAQSLPLIYYQKKKYLQSAFSVIGILAYHLNKGNEKLKLISTFNTLLRKLQVQALHMSWFARLVNRSMLEKRPEAHTCILVEENTSMLYM